MNRMRLTSTLRIICLIAVISAAGAPPPKADELSVISIGTSYENDPVSEILQNMGAKTWHPDEPPERLEEILSVSQTAARTDISACLEILSVDIRRKHNMILIANKIKNRCDKMVSYFAKGQLLNNEDFPISEERQTRHSQIPAEQEKVDLISISEKQLLEQPEHIQVYVQIVSHDNHAYGAIGKKQPFHLAAAKPEAAEAVPFPEEPCIQDIDVKARLIKAMEHRRQGSQGEQAELRRLSYIFSGANTCKEAVRIIGTVRILDKDGFDQFGRISSFRPQIMPGQTIKARGSELMVPNIVKNVENFDALFEVAISDHIFWSKRIPLEDM